MASSGQGQRRHPSPVYFVLYGLSNTVVVAGDMFNGKKVKEDINVITKLRTLSSQRNPEREDGSSWAFDPDHLIQAVRHWKMKNHICLRGIRFPDIVDVESTSSMTEKQRRDNEEKVIKSWKYFTSKPSDLLARYHKSFLEELGFSDEEEFEEWWNSKQFSSVYRLCTILQCFYHKEKAFCLYNKPDQLIN